MSDLQVSLLIIGLIVVGGVVAYNWVQQWRLRRRLENAYRESSENVLSRQPEPAARLGAPREPAVRDVRSRGDYRDDDRQEESASFGESRTEPQLGDLDRLDSTPGAQTTTAPAHEAHDAPDVLLPPVPGFDPAIDFIVAIDSLEPISAAGLDELHTKAAACGRRFRVAGFSVPSQEWEEAGRLSSGRYAHLMLAVQLVDRRGPVDRDALMRFCAAAQECATRFSATASCQDLEPALAAARDLDAFCADADVAIGVNIIAPDGKFSGTLLRSFAEASGLTLESDGVFYYRDDTRHTLFTLDNQEPTALLPEQIKHLSTAAVTLLLDVPRVADGEVALAHMLAVGVELAQGLGGNLVDDNRVPLNDNSVRAIQQQLRSIQAKMQARDVPAGSERALRLFS